MAPRRTGTVTDERYLTVKEVAAYLQVTPQTIYVWRCKGTGPEGSRVGKHLRFRKADVDAWFDAQKSAAA